MIQKSINNYYDIFSNQNVVKKTLFNSFFFGVKKPCVILLLTESKINL